MRMVVVSVGMISQPRIRDVTVWMKMTSFPFVGSFKLNWLAEKPVYIEEVNLHYEHLKLADRDK